MPLLPSLLLLPVLAAGTPVRRSAPVTALGEKLLWTAGLLALVAVLWLLMLRGWRARARRQSDIPPLPAVPPEAASAASAAGPVAGSYVTTTRAGDWLDRVVVHGLGVRSRAEVEVGEAGVLVRRVGAPDVFLPVGQLRGVRLEPGMAGKFVEEGGLVVLTWEHGGRLLDTGFRPRYDADKERLVDVVSALLEPGRTPS